MAGRMPVGREADDPAVAEEIVLPIHEEDVVARIVIARIVVVGADAAGIVPGLPLAPLDDDPRVRHARVAAGMVEVKVRGHEEAHGGDVDVDRAEARRDVVPGAELDGEEAARVAEPGGGIDARVGVKATVEEDEAVRVIDQEDGHGHAEATALPGEKAARRAREPAAREREETDRHARRERSIAGLAATAIAALVVAAPAAARCPTTGGMTAAFAAAGPHPVGTVVATLVDTSRSTPPHGSTPGAPTRTLPVEVWYPAAGGTRGNGAPLDAAGGPYPIILHANASFDSKIGELYLLDHLASHGYVVAAPDFPLSKFNAPGGASVVDLPGQPGDLRFLLAALPGLVPGVGDDAPVGVSGLSLGAITTLLVTYDRTLREPRIRAALPMAPPYACALTRRFYRATRPPLLLLHGDADVMAPSVNDELAFHRARGPRHLVTIHDGSHIGFVGFASGLSGDGLYDVLGCSVLLGMLNGDFSLPALPNERRDGIAYSPQVCPDPCQQIPTKPALDAGRQQDIARIVATAFFDAYLKHDAGARCFLRAGLARENADVSTESRR